LDLVDWTFKYMWIISGTVKNSGKQKNICLPLFFITIPRTSPQTHLHLYTLFLQVQI
jgi:hypothetical protein